MNPGLSPGDNMIAESAPAFDVIWVDEDLHRAGVGALLAARRRDPSLVDCVSFEAMRRAGITRAFPFDRHFAQQGFQSVK